MVKCQNNERHDNQQQHSHVNDNYISKCGHANNENTDKTVNPHYSTSDNNVSDSKEEERGHTDFQDDNKEAKNNYEYNQNSKHDKSKDCQRLR